MREPVGAERAKRLQPIYARLRREGYHPSPKHGRGIWLHRSDATMVTVSWRSEFALYDVYYSAQTKKIFGEK